MNAIDWLKNTTGIKRIPPICYPLVAPFIAIFFVFLGIYGSIRWLLGFWTCDFCKRSYSIRDEKHEIHMQEDWTQHKCDACITYEKLSGETLPAK